METNLDFAVLLVEDDRCVRITLKAVLQNAGYKVIEADCAQSAMSVWKMRSNEIRLLLTDYNMPGQTGAQLAEVLHTQRPDLRVIITSGRFGEDLDLPPFALFLQKPFSTHTLLEMLHATLTAFSGELTPTADPQTHHSAQAAVRGTHRPTGSQAMLWT